VKQLRIAAIVEGHGEYESIRSLLTRIWTELLDGDYLDVLRPIRHKRQQLAKKDELVRAVELASSKLAHAPGPQIPTMVLILVDADTDLPCRLAPKLLGWAREGRSGIDIVCVVANVEYETWFVAAADSLRDHLNLPVGKSLPNAPEQERLGKGWIEHHFRGTKYSETQDQPAMTAKMNLALCRTRSPSFDKLCRELARRREAEAQ
jgi:hypothetical protein